MRPRRAWLGSMPPLCSTGMTLASLEKTARSLDKGSDAPLFRLDCHRCPCQTSPSPRRGPTSWTIDYPILPRRSPIGDLDLGRFAGFLIGHGGVRPQWQIGGGSLI